MAKKTPKKRKKTASDHDLGGETRIPFSNDLFGRLNKALKDMHDIQREQDMKSLVSTRCPDCNLRLVIPKVESSRCVLCKCENLEKKDWDGHDQGVLPRKT